MVSCDEMRDHLFQMLAPKYFRKWKQRHQVYFKCAAAQRSVPSCRFALHEHKAHQSRPNKQNYLNLDTLLQSAGKAGKETTCICIVQVYNELLHACKRGGWPEPSHARCTLWPCALRWIGFVRMGAPC